MYDKVKEDETRCSVCNTEYGTINHKGRAVVKGPKSMCRPCYSKIKKPKKICSNCGNIMLSGSNTGLCVVCRDVKRRPYTRKIKELPYVDEETYEAVRRLLVRFKFGNNNIVDNFRVVDVYVELCENPIFLDTLTEEAQIVEMLRYLKKVYDYNKVDREMRLEIEKKKAENKAKYYKYKKKEKGVNKTADIKSYMKAYRKEYSRREAKN
jgi:hypothetical protein